MQFYFCAGCNEGLLIGDADGSGVYDVDDNVYLIAVIFSSGPDPAPLAAASGDANCSCGDPMVDIDDVVYLINFIFASGPDPCSCEDWVAACGPLQ